MSAVAMPESPLTMPANIVAPAPTQGEKANFVAKLKAQTIACRIHHLKMGVRKALTKPQVQQAAAPFQASSDAISAAKKIINTRDQAYREVCNVRARATAYWKSVTVPFPEPGTRLLRRSRVEEFNAKMAEFVSELNQAAVALQANYEPLKEEAKTQLGELYNPTDYPDRLDNQFELEWDYPSVEPPDHLKNLHPEMYEQEKKKIEARFEEAVRLTEQAMLEQLNKLVRHLAERLAGDEDGKPKKFKDSAVENLNAFFEQFRSLDIGSSEELQKLVSDAQSVIQGVKAEDLRAGGDVRSNVESGLKGLAEKMDELMVVKPKRAIRLTDEE